MRGARRRRTPGEGRPHRRATLDAAVAGDGTIWFSDSSRHHGIDRWKADMVENTTSGRLLRRAPDGSVSVVLEGLRFANGVALAPDGSYVAVAETAGRTVVRRWLRGARAGRTEGVREHGGRVWLGSLVESAVAAFDVRGIGD